MAAPTSARPERRRRMRYVQVVLEASNKFAHRVVVEADETCVLHDPAEATDLNLPLKMTL
jgi:hypothetical protein